MLFLFLLDSFLRGSLLDLDAVGCRGSRSLGCTLGARCLFWDAPAIVMRDILQTQTVLTKKLSAVRVQHIDVVKRCPPLVILQRTHCCCQLLCRFFLCHWIEASNEHNLTAPEFQKNCVLQRFQDSEAFNLTKHNSLQTASIHQTTKLAAKQTQKVPLKCYFIFSIFLGHCHSISPVKIWVEDWIFLLVHRSLSSLRLHSGWVYGINRQAMWREGKMSKTDICDWVYRHLSWTPKG